MGSNAFIALYCCAGVAGWRSNVIALRCIAVHCSVGVAGASATWLGSGSGAATPAPHSLPDGAETLTFIDKPFPSPN